MSIYRGLYIEVVQTQCIIPFVGVLCGLNVSNIILGSSSGEHWFTSVIMNLHKSRFCFLQKLKDSTPYHCKIS